MIDYCFFRIAICQNLVFLRKFLCQDDVTSGAESIWSHAEPQRSPRFEGVFPMIFSAFPASWREWIWLRPEAALCSSRISRFTPSGFLPSQE